MPNWASVAYKVTASAEDRNKLYSIMKELEDAPNSIPNDFGNCWFGGLVQKLGGNPNKIYCRGWWNQVKNTDNCLEIYSECAWGELADLRHFIESKFPGMKIYYQCEEPGMIIYQTNSFEYFPEQYYLWVEDMDIEPYVEDLNELILTVEDITGRFGLKTLKDCQDAMEDYSSEHDDLGYTLEEYQLVDD